MLDPNVAAKIEEIRQEAENILNWAANKNCECVECIQARKTIWLLTQLQAERQKNASPENESWKKRETLDKFADYCIQRNVMLAENKTLREALEPFIAAGQALNKRLEAYRYSATVDSDGVKIQFRWLEFEHRITVGDLKRCAALAKDGDK